MKQDDKIIIKYAGGSDIGKVRKKNEDSFLCCEFPHSDVSLFIVADGVGGYAGGEVASKMAVDLMQESVSKAVILANSGSGYDKNWLSSTLKHAVIECNQQICDAHKQQPQYSEMATTLVVLLIKGENIAINHLGDSRCYVCENDTLQQITEDHTMLQDMLNEKKISQHEFETLPLHHMISKALGLSEITDVMIDARLFSEKTSYLLCSDGLTNCISDAQIHHIINKYENLDDAINELITRANDNGGGDNITAVVVSR